MCGGGTLRHLVAVPSALVLGALIVSLDWRLGKALWLRCQRYSKQAQNAVAIALFAVELLWIVVGSISGFKLWHLSQSMSHGDLPIRMRLAWSALVPGSLSRFPSY